jgi:hypothetical protein
LDLEQFTQLATSTAVYLTRQRQGEWTVTEITELHPGYPQALLAGPDHAQLKIKHGWGAAGKVTVYGMMPSKYGYDRYEYAKHANVAPERGAKTIANEARRRVLDAGYLAELPQRVYAWETELAEAGVRAGIMARAAGLFGLPTPGDAPLNLSRFLPNRRGQVELSSDGLPQMSIELHGLDPDVGLRMLQALSSSFMVSGSCCRKFGPGHHPQFEVAGCLRERRNGDEHDWASRRRVRELLTSHGIGAEEADRALDDAQASRYQVAEVYDGGKILAIVSWDHDGCGEYTVELAGKDKPAQLSYDESEALFDAWREKSEGKNWADYYAGTDIHPAWR